MNTSSSVEQAARLIRQAECLFAFTGAGISVESGIPPFRGSNGLWDKYDPKVLELDYFLSDPAGCWIFIREIFYDFFDRSRPNDAHLALARLEGKGIVQSVVTQNIDNLHQEAGSKIVREFHGNSKQLVCLKCRRKSDVRKFDLRQNFPPHCPHDDSILKPDFVFFGEGIPNDAYSRSFEDAEKADLCLIVGSTGEVVPASYVPYTAKQHGAKIIEINPEKSAFTGRITDIWLKGKAAETLLELERLLVL